MLSQDERDQLAMGVSLLMSGIGLFLLGAAATAVSVIVRICSRGKYPPEATPGPVMKWVIPLVLFVVAGLFILPVLAVKASVLRAGYARAEQARMAPIIAAEKQKKRDEQVAKDRAAVVEKAHAWVGQLKSADATVRSEALKSLWKYAGNSTAIQQGLSTDDRQKLIAYLSNPPKESTGKRFEFECMEKLLTRFDRPAAERLKAQRLEQPESLFPIDSESMTDVAWEAIQAGHLDMLKRLLDEGVDPQGIQRNGNSLVSAALDRRSRPALRLLLEHGLPATTASELLATRANPHNDERLQDAALYLEFHADPNCRDFNGNPLLANTVFWGDVDLARLLLEHGAKPNILNKKGRTPLDLTHDMHPSKRAAMVALLKEHGALTSMELDSN